jgi:cysteinyl-tRNA synthetase
MEEIARMRERVALFLEKMEGAERSLPERGRKRKVKNSKIEKKFIAAMDDDFNTPKALAAIFELVTLGNTLLSQNDPGSAKAVEKIIRDFGGVLGLDLKKPKAALRQPSAAEEHFEREIKELIRSRDRARRDKNFKKADEIRANLLKKGIVLEDTKEGTTWRRKL